ncbi:hypothetical protein CJ030_MR1G017591 [Morella rubra]|uniref:Uncharacterized protein n=1 Tax=Morella rubra TaxID=262757 RepID=A0A6A1WSZ3_9ROSI|nr:hypothetical protein CJ030_MR1G017591 [Morella rubra]
MTDRCHINEPPSSDIQEVSKAELDKTAEWTNHECDHWHREQRFPMNGMIWVKEKAYGELMLGNSRRLEKHNDGATTRPLVETPQPKVHGKPMQGGSQSLMKYIDSTTSWPLTTVVQQRVHEELIQGRS